MPISVARLQSGGSTVYYVATPRATAHGTILRFVGGAIVDVVPPQRQRVRISIIRVSQFGRSIDIVNVWSDCRIVGAAHICCSPFSVRVPPCVTGSVN